jgi:hypothetical protein
MTTIRAAFARLHGVRRLPGLIHRYQDDAMRGLLRVSLIASVFFVSAPALAEQCQWRLKEGSVAAKGGGVVCQSIKMHYQMATLACEFAPLHLDLQSDCDAHEDRCGVRVDLDSGAFSLQGAYFPVGQIWASFIRIPMSMHQDFLNALRASKQVTVRVDGREAWDLPTKGLDETVRSLQAQCEDKTS